MTSDDGTDNRWHTNYWVWLVIAIPALTIVGCMVTIWLAITNPETIVTDRVPDQVSSTRTARDALP
ncbi:MAG: FixH family protein [Halioglobus sp.]|nr:FixH family protein [Halioglobus sp.]